MAGTCAGACEPRLLSFSVGVLLTETKYVSCKTLWTWPYAVLQALSTVPPTHTQTLLWSHRAEGGLHSFLRQEMLGDTCVQRGHHGIIYPSQGKRKTVDRLNGMGESLQLLHILLTDCGAVFLMMLRRIMAWKMLLA